MSFSRIPLSFYVFNLDKIIVLHCVCVFTFSQNITYEDMK